METTRLTANGTRSLIEKAGKDAILASAAPELLEALKGLMPLLDRDDVRDTWFKEFEAAQQAINKAEGDYE